VALKTCKVAIPDTNGIEHIAQVYEAVARRIAALDSASMDGRPVRGLGARIRAGYASKVRRKAIQMIKPMCDVCVREAGYFHPSMHMRELPVRGPLERVSYGCSAHERIYNPQLGYFSSNPHSQRAPFTQTCQKGTCTFAMYVASAASADENTWLFRCVEHDELSSNES
jgi:hypothetical protein